MACDAPSVSDAQIARKDRRLTPERVTTDQADIERAQAVSTLKGLGRRRGRCWSKRRRFLYKKSSARGLSSCKGRRGDAGQYGR